MGWLFQESGGRTSPSRIGLNSKDVLEILFIKRGREVHENYIVFFEKVLVQGKRSNLVSKMLMVKNLGLR